MLPVLTQHGTRDKCFKYGTIPYNTGRLATLRPTILKYAASHTDRSFYIGYDKNHLEIFLNEIRLFVSGGAIKKNASKGKLSP